jgi:Ca2+-binding EF-hand superfamily protein
MGGKSSKRNNLLSGQPTNKEMQQLSETYKIPIANLKLLRQKYGIYRNHTGKINVFNYVVMYREFVNLNAPEAEIYKSFNAFDTDRDGFLDFIVRACT